MLLLREAVRRGTCPPSCTTGHFQVMIVVHLSRWSQWAVCTSPGGVRMGRLAASGADRRLGVAACGRLDPANAARYPAPAVHAWDRRGPGRDGSALRPGESVPARSFGPA